MKKILEGPLQPGEVMVFGGIEFRVGEVPVILKRDEDLARKGYEAYYQETPAPEWETLPLHVKDKWTAAARAIAAAAVQQS